LQFAILIPNFTPMRPPPPADKITRPRALRWNVARVMSWTVSQLKINLN
jgi:hypothetical protein